MGDAVGDISKEDIRESRELILDEMRRGFDVMHRKQDQTNGRLLRLEETTARHDERVLTLERERQEDDQEAADDGIKALTRRDLTVAVAAIMAVIAVLAWLGHMPGVPR